MNPNPTSISFFLSLIDRTACVSLRCANEKRTEMKPSPAPSANPQKNSQTYTAQQLDLIQGGFGVVLGAFHHLHCNVGRFSANPGRKKASLRQEEVKRHCKTKTSGDHWLTACRNTATRWRNGPSPASAPPCNDYCRSRPAWRDDSHLKGRVIERLIGSRQE